MDVEIEGKSIGKGHCQQGSREDEDYEEGRRRRGKKAAEEEGLLMANKVAVQRSPSTAQGYFFP